MSEFPYANNPASLKKFLEHIQGGGVPTKVTLEYLASVGFKSANDRPILRVLKSIGFVGNAGEPTDLWVQYRDKKAAKKVMALALQSAYSELFAVYPAAYRRDAEALRNFFSTKTKLGENALALTVRTFKALCEIADFETAPAEGAMVGKRAKKAEAEPETPSVVKVKDANGMTVNINIQLTLPATTDAAVYDKFFAAMKKHLVG